MRYIPVESSNLDAVAYDDSRKELRVRFKSGAEHVHVGVPPDEHSRLMAAESHGKHYNQFIKGKYTGHQGERPPMPPGRDDGSAPINERPTEANLDEAIRRFTGPIS